VRGAVSRGDLGRRRRRDPAGRGDPARHPPLPTCPECGGIARPNLLLFDDRDWLAERYVAQEKRLLAWAGGIVRRGEKLVVVECGAGGAIPTVRYLSDRFQASGTATLIRINPREPEGPRGTISIAAGARETLEAIDRAL
jgi:hypothetical protein